MPWYAAWKTRFCRAVSARSRLDRCGTTDSRLRAVTGSAATSTPATLALPDVGQHPGREHADRRRLAGAVGAEQAEDLTALDGEGDAVDGVARAGRDSA